MFQEHPLAHDRARYAQGGIPWNSYSSVCPKTSLWSMRVYWMKVHMRFCECACLRGGCVWRQSVWVWVHSCRDDVTSWKLIYSAYRWGHWFLELGSGSLNEEFPAVMASCYGALRFLCVSVCVCAGVWGGGGAVQTQPISKATALRHVYQCLPSSSACAYPGVISPSGTEEAK